MSQVHGYLCAAWIYFSIQHIQPNHGIFIAILPIEKSREGRLLFYQRLRYNSHNETRSIKSTLHSLRAQTTLVPHSVAWNQKHMKRCR